MKHTPGPWTISDFDQIDDYRINVRGSDGNMIGAAYTEDAITPTPEEEANARLIAAAPELLEALEGLLAHIWDNRKANVRKDYSLMVAEVAAQNAIAKATN